MATAPWGDFARYSHVLGVPEAASRPMMAGICSSAKFAKLLPWLGVNRWMKMATSETSGSVQRLRRLDVTASRPGFCEDKRDVEWWCGWREMGWFYCRTAFMRRTLTPAHAASDRLVQSRAADFLYCSVLPWWSQSPGQGHHCSSPPRQQIGQYTNTYYVQADAQPAVLHSPPAWKCGET